MTRAAVVLCLALAAAIGVAVWRGQVAERRIGALEAALVAAEAREDSARAVTARLDTVYRRDTLRLTRTLTRVDSLRDSLTVTDTVEVVRFIAALDTAVAACTAALRTCEARVAAERAVTATVRDQLRLTRALARAPRTAVGLAWDPRAGVGLSGDRDYGRLRLGATVTPGGGVARLSWWW